MDKLNAKVKKMLSFSVFLGVSQFFVEYSFVLALQGFFIRIGGAGAFESLPDFYKENPFTSILVFGILKAVLGSFRTFFSIFIYEDLRASFRAKIIESINWKKGGVHFHDLLTLINDRVNSLGLYYQGRSLLFVDLVSLVSLSGYAMYISPKLFLFSTLAAFFLLPLKLLSSKMNFYSLIYNETSRLINKYVFDTVSNINILGMYNLETKYFSRGIQEIKKYNDAVVRFYFLFALKASYPLIVGFIFVAFIGYLGHEYFSLTADVIISFIYIFLRISQLSSSCIMNISEMKKNHFSLELINNFFKKNNNDFNQKESGNKHIIQEGELRLSLENIRYSYGDKELFKELSFSVKTGQVLNIKGKSGAGKSTLVRLMLGHALPSSGKIQLNGISTSENSAGLAEVVGYVGPENYFSKEESLRENLLYGNQDPLLVSDKDIIATLEALDLGSFCSSLKLSELILSPPQFSTGQAQRLGIARALLRKPRILILDEATANLDIKTERFVIEFLKKIKKDMIVILITHKESLNEIFDLVVDLDEKM